MALAALDNTQDVVAWLRQQTAFRQPRVQRAGVIPTGQEELDALLGGGLPRGGIVELTGGAGRTALSMSALAAATQRGEYVAWIDGADALDPLSVMGSGVCPERFLWIRPRAKRGRVQEAALKAADLVLDAGGFALVVLDLVEFDPPRARFRGGKSDSRASHSGWWVRLARRVEVSDSTFISLAPLESFCSSVRLECRAQKDLNVCVEVTRQRFGVPGGVATLALLPPVD